MGTLPHESGLSLASAELPWSPTVGQAEERWAGLEEEGEAACIGLESDVCALSHASLAIGACVIAEVGQGEMGPDEDG